MGRADDTGAAEEDTAHAPANAGTAHLPAPALLVLERAVVLQDGKTLLGVEHGALLVILKPAGVLSVHALEGEYWPIAASPGGEVDIAVAENAVRILTSSPSGADLEIEGEILMQISLPPRLRDRTAAAPALAQNGILRARETLRGLESADPENLGTRDRELYEELRAWRLEVARSIGMSAFVIATNVMLAAIARGRPRNSEELAAVPGMGPSRISKYGDDIIRIVADAN